MAEDKGADPLEIELPEEEQEQVWEPGLDGRDLYACPLCGASVQGRYMPAHVVEEHEIPEQVQAIAAELWDEEKGYRHGKGVESYYEAAKRAIDAGSLPTREDPPEAPEDAEESKRALLDAEERLTGVFYLLMRDALPTAQVHALVEQIAQSSGKFNFSAEELEALARRYAKAVLGSKNAIMPRPMRDWLDGFPDRIRSAECFDAVVAEFQHLPMDQKAQAAITAEVIKRQRAARDEAIES